MIKSIWNVWMKFVVIFGNIQMTLIVSVVYWVVLPFTGVIAALVSDPLERRLRHKSTWIKRSTCDRHPDSLDELRRQG